MTAFKTSLPHRTAYLVLFLVMAVTLTAALLLAAERSAPGTGQSAAPTAACAGAGRSSTC
jgi:hypothetical protein